MKRRFSFALLISLMLVLGLAVTAMAQGNGPDAGPTDDCPRIGQNGAGQNRGENAGDCPYGMPRDGSGQQLGRDGDRPAGQMRRMDQSGASFADEDGDGVCDYAGDGGRNSRSSRYGQNRADEANQAQRQGNGAMGGHHGARGNR